MFRDLFEYSFEPVFIGPTPVRCWLDRGSKSADDLGRVEILRTLETLGGLQLLEFVVGETHLASGIQADSTAEESQTDQITCVGTTREEQTDCGQDRAGGYGDPGRIDHPSLVSEETPEYGVQDPPSIERKERNERNREKKGERAREKEIGEKSFKSTNLHLYLKASLMNKIITQSL